MISSSHTSLLHYFGVFIIAAESLQSCLTLCDPIDGSPPGSPSLGFSRQEHWSGLPFPSPMHESEKWKWSRSVVSDPQWPHGLQPRRLLRPRDFPGKSTGVGCKQVKTARIFPLCDSVVVQLLSCIQLFCSPMDCSLPGSSLCGISQAGILEWVAISFSRGIIPSQGSNPCLLHWQVDSLLLSLQENPLCNFREI